MIKMRHLIVESEIVEDEDGEVCDLAPVDSGPDTDEECEFEADDYDREYGKEDAHILAKVLRGFEFSASQFDSHGWYTSTWTDYATGNEWEESYHFHPDTPEDVKKKVYEIFKK